MGLLSELLLLPLAPVRATRWTVEQVLETAEREYYDPATIRRELAELSQALDDGLISEAEFDQREDELLDLLATGQNREIEQPPGGETA